MASGLRSLTSSAKALFAALGLALASQGAQAAGWHYYDPECPIALGTKSMKFVAMQPKKNIDRVCDALGDTGATVIVLDAPDPELRDMTLDVRVLKDGGDDAVFQLPLEKHRNGMLNFDHNFKEAGKYVLSVKLVSDDGATQYAGRHPFTVGLLDNTEFYTYLLFGGFLALLGAGGLYGGLRKRKQA